MEPKEVACGRLQSSQGDDTKYYDVRERQRSPPRYERAVLERLHEVVMTPHVIPHQCSSMAVSCQAAAIDQFPSSPPVWRRHVLWSSLKLFAFEASPLILSGSCVSVCFWMSLFMYHIASMLSIAINEKSAEY